MVLFLEVFPFTICTFLPESLEKNLMIFRLAWFRSGFPFTSTLNASLSVSHSIIFVEGAFGLTMILSLLFFMWFSTIVSPGFFALGAFEEFGFWLISCSGLDGPPTRFFVAALWTFCFISDGMNLRLFVDYLYFLYFGLFFLR